MSEENSHQPINNAAELQQRYAQGERDFSKANLAEADLRDTDLKGVNLQGANLKGANLRGANLKDANLQGAILKETDFRGANLSAANLKGAYLCGTYLELAMLQRVDLQQANMRGANLGGAMLIEACLDKADLTYADFSDTYAISQGGSGGANLEGASLRGANLKGANLHGANLSGANLKEAEIKGAYLQGAFYDGKTRLPTGSDSASLGMQKNPYSSSKQLSSSVKPSNPVSRSKQIFTLCSVAGITIVLAPVGILHWTASNKSKTIATATSEPEAEVSYEANKPLSDAEIEKMAEAIKPKSTSTSQANKTQAKPEQVAQANKAKSSATPNANSKTQSASAAKPAGATSNLAQVASCPALVRAINAAKPDNPSAVDVSVNGKKVISNVLFSQASRYVSVQPGQLHIKIMKAGTKTLVDERKFAAAANTAYSVAVTGSLPGPPGQLLFNKSPFVIPEDLSPPSPGKFKGKWYRLSEMKAAIDLRIAKLDAANNTQARLVDVIPKTAVVYPELKAGTYNFNTALPNKSDPIINTAYKPPIRVEIAKAKIPAGTIFDVFAIGNDIGKKGRNSLKLSAASYKTLPPTATGCTRVQ